ncbi:MAG: molybdopterin biosynthesis protein [Bacillota bacterium]
MDRTVYLSNVPYEDARETFFSAIDEFLMPGETVPVTRCLGRVTAEPVFARLSSPHYHAAAMDGVAVKAEATFGARETSPKTLTVNADAFWADTGDPLPSGTNAVIMVEDVHDIGDGTLEIISPVSPWENVRVYGEDMVETELILPANCLLRPQDLGAILAGGVREIRVRRRPRVSIIPTGSELVPPDTDPGPGEIIEFNSTVFRGMLQEWGADPSVSPIQPDVFQDIREAVIEVLDQSDIVLIGAGSSHGSEDYSAKVIQDLGTVLVHGIATRPGKPVVLGVAKGKPIIGVPGYPVSAALIMDLFVKPLVQRMLGLPESPGDKTPATLSRSITSPMGVTEFVRVKLGKVGDKLVATPIRRGAALTTSMVRADGVVTVPGEVEGISAGQIVEVDLYRCLHEVLGQVVAIGSHDITLDVIASMLRNAHRGMSLSSANQGSLGGLIALRRQECHLAGTHLLDETTGKYNIAHVQKYLPNADIRLVTLAYRLQGFIVQKGNPKNIQGVRDLTRPDVSFVNRQKGSGTRVLLDYVLKLEDIDPQIISGYDREEYTHTQVAASVKSGAADVGLGVLSAARALDLDFVPWREERYDLAIPAEHLHHPGVRAILDLITTQEFKDRIERLGGYDTRDTGKIVWPREEKGP